MLRVLYTDALIRQGTHRLKEDLQPDVGDSGTDADQDDWRP